LAEGVLKEDDKAERDLLKASHLQPDDATIKAELSKVRERVKAKKELEKKKFKKLFADN
jgi:peptidyl-prolyl isomerase D